MIKQKVKPKAIKLKRDTTSTCHTPQLLKCLDIPWERKTCASALSAETASLKAKRQALLTLNTLISSFPLWGNGVVRRQTGKGEKSQWALVRYVTNPCGCSWWICKSVRSSGWQQHRQLDEQNLAWTPGTCPTAHSGPITSVPVASSVAILVLGMVRAGAGANMHGLESWQGYPLTVSSWWNY